MSLLLYVVIYFTTKRGIKHAIYSISDTVIS